MPARDHKPKIAELARLIKTLDREVSRCSRCGMCQAVCPVYGLTGHENDTARGKIALLDGLARQMFADADGTAARLNHCLLCGSCGAGCPMNIDAAALFLRARSIIAGFRGLSWWKRLFFRWILARPARFDRFLAWASRFQSLALRQAPSPPDGSCARLAVPRMSGRHVVPLAPVPFHIMTARETDSGKTLLPRLSAPASPETAGEVEQPVRVAFFVGCLLDKVFPDTARNIVQVLRKNGVTVVIPRDQGCCGMPALAAGDREAFSRLINDHLVRFDPDQFDYLVTGCATCTAAIKKFWPEMTADGGEPVRRIMEQIADKTHDISEFLVNILGIDGDRTLSAAIQAVIPTDISESPASVRPGSAETVEPPAAHGVRQKVAPCAPVAVTWHDPCHLAKTLGVRNEPRLLIRSNPALVFREMPDADRCCGMGGSFNLQYYNDSAAIGARKAEAIRASGASVVATGCPACMIQLADMLARENLAVAVRHVIDIVADKN